MAIQTLPFRIKHHKHDIIYNLVYQLGDYEASLLNTLYKSKK
jgi:hypothetical protein